VELPPAAAAMPAFGDDLLESGATSYGEEPARTLEPSATPAQFDDFAIQLEPLPMDSEGEHGSPQAWSDPMQSRIEQRTPAHGTDAPAAPEFPLEFELDDLADGEQPASEEVLVDLSPFTSQPAEPAQPERSDESLEAISEGSAKESTGLQDWGNGPAIELDELMGEPEPAVAPEPEPTADAADAAAQELEQMLQVSLPADQDEQAPASPQEDGVAEHEADAAEPTVVQEPTTGITQEMSGGQEVEDVASTAAGESTDSIIDLDSLLNQENSDLDLPTIEPAANSEPTLAVQRQQVSEQPEVNQDLAERIAERVLERLKPIVIEEIRKALNES
jgi:hypothetical protein